MPETHTEIRDGLTVTVWMSKYSYSQWLYIITSVDYYDSGHVTASNRTEAVNAALETVKR